MLLRFACFLRPNFGIRLPAADSTMNPFVFVFIFALFKGTYDRYSRDRQSRDSYSRDRQSRDSYSRDHQSRDGHSEDRQRRDSHPRDPTQSPLHRSPPEDNHLQGNSSPPNDFTENPPGSSTILPVPEEQPELTLSDDIMEVIGKRIETENVVAPALHSSLAIRWKEITQHGLKKEERESLLVKYPLMANCLFLKPPTLNAEVKNAITDVARTRDQRLVHKQLRTATCLAGIGKSLTTMLADDFPNKLQHIETLSDVARLLADSLFDDIGVRRNLILSLVNTSLKEPLQTSQVDEFLFGEKLADTIKAAKILNQTTAELKGQKQPAPQPKNAKLPPRRPFAPQQATAGGFRPPVQQTHQPYRRRQPTTRPRSTRRPSPRRQYSKNQRDYKKHAYYRR